MAGVVELDGKHAVRGKGERNVCQGKKYFELARWSTHFKTAPNNERGKRVSQRLGEAPWRVLDDDAESTPLMMILLF